MARSKTKAKKPVFKTDIDISRLEPEEESSCAEEIHEALARERAEGGFVSFEEYARRRGIKL